MTLPRPDGDRTARRQLLLTRIAVERVQLAHELQRVQRATSVGRVLAAGLAATPFAGLFSAPAGGAAQPWAATLLTLWRRWRRVAPVFGPVAGLLSPLFGRHRWLRRTALFAVLAAGLWAARRSR